ncbi:hypothetical protein RHMOL_Rhmol02G0286400 [Rhododendron molle]|uniref:Uncharacterized protein n=1 Tax=Rhododendron molle TaxID=49168 RepID=A0ACC0PV16_RHOML|nr:hypothetical protein RHMOL_Rhmol02G0286400 [Rhododendron molle]
MFHFTSQIWTDADNNRAGMLIRLHSSPCELNKLAWADGLAKTITRRVKVYKDHLDDQRPSQDTIAAGHDLAPVGIEGDLMAWWLRKKGSSLEGRAREMCSLKVTSPSRPRGECPPNVDNPVIEVFVSNYGLWMLEFCSLGQFPVLFEQ